MSWQGIEYLYLELRRLSDQLRLVVFCMHACMELSNQKNAYVIAKLMYSLNGIACSGGFRGGCSPPPPS